MEQLLKRKGWSAVAIHGDISQAQRTAAVEAFKAGTTPLLIATDVAARGLDIPDVEVRRRPVGGAGEAAGAVLLHCSGGGSRPPCWSAPCARLTRSIHPLAPARQVVINYSFPLTIEDYVHRIGRTGRAGKTGAAVTFFSAVSDKPRAGELINVLKEAGQPVPEELYKFGTTVKKKEHGLYGAHYKDVDLSKKATKVTFDDDD